MFFMDTIGVKWKNHTKHINKLMGKIWKYNIKNYSRKTDFLNVKRGVIFNYYSILDSYTNKQFPYL
jgi:hypothetical protein